MALMFGGLQALVVAEKDLRDAVASPPEPGEDFTRCFPAATWRQATDELRLALATAPAELSEAASCALCCLAYTVGNDAGFVKVPVEVGHEFAPFARTWLPKMLRDEHAYDKALASGAFGVKGAGRFAFGALTGRQIRVADWSTYEPPDDDAIVAVQGDAWIEMLADAFSTAAEICSNGRVLLLLPHWVDVPEPPPPPPDEPPPPSLALDELLSVAASRGASDIVFTVGSPPLLRIDGTLTATEYPALDAQTVRQSLDLVLTESQRDQFERNGRLVFSFGVAGVARFRAACYLQRGVMAATLRVLPLKPPAWAETKLPDALAELERGIVAIGGHAGRTVAAHALVARIVETSPRHVLTVEEPLAIVQPNGVGVVTQIDVGADAPSFAAAMETARHAAPDVVLIDHIDAPERFAAACELAGAGRLVIATVNARDAASVKARVPKELLVAVVVLSRDRKPAVWRKR